MVCYITLPFFYPQKYFLFSLPTFFFWWGRGNSKGFPGFQQFDCLRTDRMISFQRMYLVETACASSVLNLISHWLVIMDGRKACINTELEDTINMFYRRNKQSLHTVPWNVFQERSENYKFGSQTNHVRVVKVYQETLWKMVGRGKEIKKKQ